MDRAIAILWATELIGVTARGGLRAILVNFHLRTMA